MRYVILATLLLLAACESHQQQPNAAADSSAKAPTAVAAAAPGAAVDSVTGTGDKFDAMRAQTGNAIGTLRIASLDVQPATQTLVGVKGAIGLKGQLQLSGDYRAHYEYPVVKQACFYPAAEDWKKIPRAKGDERAIWFCFDNQEDAIKQLGALGTQTKATIVVENYTIKLDKSNVWDTARLVRVVTKGK
jgi:hypothetical protein